MISIEVPGNFHADENTEKKIFLTLDQEGKEDLIAILTKNKLGSLTNSLKLLSEEWEVGDISSKKFNNNTTTPHILEITFVD